MKLPARLERCIDIGGLLTALVVDLILNIICFYVLAPDWLTSIAFVSIGIMCVLFIFRSWSKGQKKTYALFVVIVFFFDLSFTLVATKAQGNVTTIENDSELTRLTNQADIARQQVLDLQLQYKEAAKRETMDQIKSMIDTAQADSVRANTARDNRMAAINDGRAGRAVIKSETIFSSIPDAVTDARYIQLVIFGLIFVGLQLIVASSIDGKAQGVSVAVPPEPVTPPAPVEPATAPTEHPAPPPAVTSDQISQFVTLSWYRVDQKTSDHILPEDAFFDYMSKKNIQYDHKAYEYLFALCIKIKIMNDDGFILIKTKNQAIDALEKGMYS